MGHLDHKKNAPRKVRCAVVTVSDTRTPGTDSSGALIKKLLVGHEHVVTDYRIVKDDPSAIRKTLLACLADPMTQAVLLTGGTGISKHDSTYEVVQNLLEKEIEGFGELFRHLSFQSIGSPAILSRATAGVSKGKILISLPGSEDAVDLGMKSLVLPELSHMVYLIQ